MAGRLEGDGVAVTGPGSGIGYASVAASAWRGADAAASVHTDREQKDPGSDEDLFRRVAEEPGTTVSVDGGLMQNMGQGA